MLPMGGTGVIGGVPQLVHGVHHGQGGLISPMGGTGVTGGLSGGPGGRFDPGHVQGRVGSQNGNSSGTSIAQHGQAGRISPIGGTGVMIGGICPIGGTGVIGGSCPMGGTGVAGGRGLNIPPMNCGSAASVGAAVSCGSAATGWYTSTGVATDGNKYNGMVNHPLLCNGFSMLIVCDRRLDWFRHLQWAWRRIRFRADLHPPLHVAA
ncbi:MAG: hypothetical protein FWD06_09910 [Oscillospiraceae bacterium]|nr:hypothetical protein [Oscillospiraceae bacterium]